MLWLCSEKDISEIDSTMFAHANLRPILRRSFIGGHLMTGGDRLHLSTVRSKESKELLGQLPLIPGMPVNVTKNLSMPHKVVNGSEGVLRNVIYRNVPEGREAVCAYVEMPASSLQVNGLERSLMPIFPQSMQFTYTTSSRSKIKISRSQLPLISGWAFTDYKVQGASLESVIIDLYSVWGLQNTYMMLLRAKTLCRLGVLRYFPPHRVFCCLQENL
jgi:hypothetical protein